jgi:hypothetical protein
VFQHREQIHKGDVAAIWVAGEYSGIYAIADIATDPYETPRVECIREANLKYWTEEEDKDLLNGSWIRVSLRYVKLFTIPRTPFVSRKFARNDPPSKWSGSP